MSEIDFGACPFLTPGTRLQIDRISGAPVLLYPESFDVLNPPVHGIVQQCDGSSSVDEIIQRLAQTFEVEAGELIEDVRECLRDLRDRRLIAFAPRASGRVPQPIMLADADLEAFERVGDYPRPTALLAEITYQCPLHCPYCSNPLQHAGGGELTTAEWHRVLEEAASLGVLHTGFSGGEPLARPDLPSLVAAARAAGLYTNLITSGVGLSETRLAALQSAGLDTIQLSLQADEPLLGDRIAGAAVHARKLEAAQMIRRSGLPLSLNIVLHRANIDRLPQILTLAESMEAQRLELANTQYYGWAYANRSLLLPTRAQVEVAREIATAAQRRLSGRMEIFYVLPDYFEARPKPCLQGWGRRYLTVNPAGEVLPCPTAFSIPGMTFENIRARSLRWIWEESGSFNRFRGDRWMEEPCRSCPERGKDFGGCRCQAALLLGRAEATDPVCSLSPERGMIDEIVGNAEIAGATGAPWKMRQSPATISMAIRD